MKNLSIVIIEVVILGVSEKNTENGRMDDVHDMHVVKNMCVSKAHVEVVNILKDNINEGIGKN